MVNKTKNYKIVDLRGHNTLTNHLFIVFSLDRKWLSIFNHVRMRIRYSDTPTTRRAFWRKDD